MIRSACIFPTILLLTGQPALAAVVEIPLLAAPGVPGSAPADMSDDIRGKNLFLLRNGGFLPGPGPGPGRSGYLHGTPGASGESTLFDIDLFRLERPGPGTAAAPMAQP